MDDAAYSEMLWCRTRHQILKKWQRGKWSHCCNAIFQIL